MTRLLTLKRGYNTIFNFGLLKNGLNGLFIYYLSINSINRKILYKVALSCLFRILINVSITCINSCKQNFLKFAITKRVPKYKSCRFKLCQLIIHSCLYLLFTLHLFHNRTIHICKIKEKYFKIKFWWVDEYSRIQRHYFVGSCWVPMKNDA